MQQFNPYEYLKPCGCGEEIFKPRTYFYIDGSELDNTVSADYRELSENVWVHSKPPRTFGKTIMPLISARQVEITRTKLKKANVEDITLPKENKFCKGSTKKAPVSTTKKKSVITFLSSTVVNF